MRTPHRITALNITALILALLALGGIGLVACGGGEGGKGGKEVEGSGGEAAREEAERAEAAKEIPVEDRVAYYQLSTTSGLLRARLLASEHGQPIPENAGPVELRTAEKRIRMLQPHDAGLTGVQKRLLVLIGRLEASELDRAAAGRDLRRLDSINAALSRFLKREPAQAVLVPD